LFAFKISAKVETRLTNLVISGKFKKIPPRSANATINIKANQSNEREFFGGVFSAILKLDSSWEFSHKEEE
jgi:hypothetical protein